MKVKSWMGILVFSLLAGGSLVFYQNCRHTESSNGGTTIPSSLANRNYYLIEAGYSCLPQLASTPILTYKDRLEFTTTNVIAWGDGCNDAPRPVDFLPSDYSFAPDLSSVVYNGKNYVYSENPPTF